jgi:hypothetical protein
MVKLRKKSVVIIVILSILVIAVGSYFWIMNSPKYGLKVINSQIKVSLRVEKIPPMTEHVTPEYKKTHPSFPDTITFPGSTTYYHDYSITGTLKNLSYRGFSNINIKLVLYEEKSNLQIDVVDIHIDNLQSKKVYTFEVNDTIPNEIFDKFGSTPYNISLEVISITAK